MLPISPAERAIYLLTARAFWLQGCIYASKGLYEEAERELMLAVGQLTGRVGGEVVLADVYNRLGNVCFYKGRRGEATSYYEQSSSLAVAMEAPVIAARAYNNLGNVYANRGEIEQAKRCYNLALEQSQLSGGPTSIAQTNRVLAWVYSQYGPYSLALQHAREAASLTNLVDNLYSRCQILNDVGATFLRYGDYHIAEHYLREAYDLVQRTANKSLEMSIASSLADLMRAVGERSSWLTYCVRALSDSTGSTTLRCEAAARMAIYYIEQHDWKKAQYHLLWLQESYAQNNDVMAEELALMYRAQALYYAGQQDWAQAISYFEQAVLTNSYSHYELATTLQEYAQLLCRLASRDSSYKARAESTARQAADLYAQLELPRQQAMMAELTAKFTAD